MRTLKLWILAILIALGALIAPSPVVPTASLQAAEPETPKAQGYLLPSESLLSMDVGKAEPRRALPELAVGESAYVQGEFTRVNLPYEMWVKATHYSENATRVATPGYIYSTPSRVKVTRTGESTCTVDIRESDVLWTSLEVFSGDGTGKQRPLWHGPETNPGDAQVYWRVEKVVHSEPEHPVFWIPENQVPLSRRGTPLWRYKEGQEVYAPPTTIRSTPAGKGWLDGTTVVREKTFQMNGRPAMKIAVLNSWNVGLTVYGWAPKLVPKQLSRYHEWFIGRSRTKPAPLPQEGELCPKLRIWSLKVEQVPPMANLIGREGGR